MPNPSGRVPCDDLRTAVTHGYSVIIQCHCGRRRVVAPEPLLALAQQRGWGTRFKTLRLHLRCLSCNEKMCFLSATSMQPDNDLTPVGPAQIVSFSGAKRRLRG